MPNFPTAFWKKQPSAEVSSEISINWDTELWSSYGQNGETDPSEYNFPLSGGLASNFPFNTTDSNGWGEDFHSAYGSETWQGNVTPPTPYFGWYLTGGYGIEDPKEYDLQDYHRANPWIVGENEIKIFFEADFSTAGSINTPDPNPNDQGFYRVELYNHFIQSGSATGSFTLPSTSTLTIKVSGLGEDFETADGYAPHYDSMVLYLDNGSTNELICSGAAPEDERYIDEDGELVYPGIGEWDMQQVKLYAGNNLSTIVNTTDSPKGEPRGNAGQLVNQVTRDIGYTTTNGIGTFTKSNLAAGNYKIKINVSTIDAIYNSGAFYGFTFTFS
tara:strand:- start:43 stop:1032 length:990 start_codon:yes stop_codon:yes gene_type:complete